MTWFILGLLLGGPFWSVVGYLASTRTRRPSRGVSYTLSTYDRKRRLP